MKPCVSERSDDVEAPVEHEVDLEPVGNLVIGRLENLLNSIAVSSVQRPVP